MKFEYSISKGPSWLKADKVSGEVSGAPVRKGDYPVELVATLKSPVLPFKIGLLVLIKVKLSLKNL